MANHTIEVHTQGQGLIEITDQITPLVEHSGIDDGLCTIFIRHTSASLTIQENADPSAKRDLEEWLRRFIPENQHFFTHTHEGPDDMPSHIKSVLTATSISIPIVAGQLSLGTWQGIYIWEHRSRAHRRTLVVHIHGE